jgi:hypothetical protein
MDVNKDSLEYWMGSIDVGLKALNTKLDDAIANNVKRTDNIEERVEDLETWKIKSNARTGVIAGGTALAAPPFIKWVLDIFGG